MKVVFCAVLLAATVAVALSGKCTSSDECDDGQCCVGIMPFRGSCKALTKEKKKCLVDEATFPMNEIHIFACPCAEGLECVSTSTSKKNKNDGVCSLPVTEEPTTEGSSEETTTADASEETTADEGSQETTADEGSQETTVDDNSQDNTDEEQEVVETEAPEA